MITLEECRNYVLNGQDTDHDAELEIARLSAVANVQNYCGRTFEVAGAVASARTFRPLSPYRVWVDDISTTTDLVVATDDNDDGTAETTWASTDYLLHPFGGNVAGETRPYHLVEAVEGRTFPTYNQRPNSVSVTARWGWTAVPAMVKQAALIQVAADFARRNSPHGVAAFGEFGPVRVRSGMDPRVVELLSYYRHPRIALGIGG